MVRYAFLLLLIKYQMVFSKKRESINLNLTLIPMPDHFDQFQIAHLIEKVLPASKDFYFNAFKVSGHSAAFFPSLSSCGPVSIPKNDLISGVSSDVQIYLHSNLSYSYIALGQFCQQDPDQGNRPRLGQIGLSSFQFFNLDYWMQIQFIIREIAHVLVFDKSLFPSFRQKDGSNYTSETILSLNYPKRGKTVSMLSFPKVLQKAQVAFECDLAGLELEDYFEENSEDIHPIFWDSRVMTHDILSSFLNRETIFSDISFALFEDSGWYIADYSFAQSIKWGLKAGCSWHNEKCVDDLKVLPGFCNEKKSVSQCDSFSLSYGECYLVQDTNIPPHESYFPDSQLGGLGLYDYCPTVIAVQSDRCRESTDVNQDIGENKGIKSRCFMNSLSTSQSSDSYQAGCYHVEKCSETSVIIRVGIQIIECKYGSSVQVPGYFGKIKCPDSQDFCFNVPCLHMCSGRGKCINGLCHCSSGWSGNDCSVKCPASCATCNYLEKCIDCAEGFYKQDSFCLPCSSNCKTCEKYSHYCTSCEADFELTKNYCSRTCLAKCKSCDVPCSICDSGFYVEDGQCSECDENCLECLNQSDFCISCQDGMILVDRKCRLQCVEGCIDCSKPCLKCKDGFLISMINGKDDIVCLPCSGLCKTCVLTYDLCTSCHQGFTLDHGTCHIVCSPHCLTCDSPCSQCEDGFYHASEVCLPCSKACQTCSKAFDNCTSCKEGSELADSKCVPKCIKNCSTCSFPCEQCEDGFLSFLGTCIPCISPCKTCSSYAYHCESCVEGYGLVNFACISHCSDHCSSCDTPCSTCEMGYFKTFGSCHKCDKSCKTCIEKSDNCLECSEGYSFAAKKCIKKCLDFCLSCDYPCSECISGYFISDNICKSCESPCLTCSLKSTNCTSCSHGFGILYNDCVEGCSDHCVSCNVPCSLCQEGFFPAGQNCEPCSSNCLTCIESPDKCTSCREHEILQGHECFSLCVPHCLTCEVPCLACEEGFEVQDNSCITCPAGCSTCSNNQCFTCSQGFHLSDYKCQKDCEAFCKTCNFPCINCEVGYLSVFGKCLKCQEPCVSCAESVNQCTVCPKNYQLVGHSCQSLCIDHCLSCDEPCSQCDSGYFKKSGKCEPCSEKCRTCESNSETCTSCQSWQKLEKGSCKDECLRNCNHCGFPCRSCEEGFKLEAGLCVKCQEYLRSPQVSANFLEDLSGLLLDFSVRVVEQINDCGFYFTSSCQEMLHIKSKCFWTSFNQMKITLAKNADFSIRTLELFPVPVFGSTCMSVPGVVQVGISLGFVRAPLASISAPHYFSISCNEDILVINGLTEESVFAFEVTSEPFIAPIHAFLADHLKSKSLAIPQNLLQETLLNVTFTVKNKLGQSRRENHLIEVTQAPKLSSYVDLGSQIDILNTRDYSIRGAVVPNSCFDVTKARFKWTFLSFGTLYDPLPMNVLKNSKKPYILDILKGSLAAGSRYLFRFEVFEGNFYDFSDILVNVLTSPLIVRLDRTDGSTNIDEDLKISAALSFDPDDNTNELNFTWHCVAPGNDLERLAFINETSGAVLHVPKHSLSKGVYLFTVTVETAKKKAVLSVKITANESPGFIKFLGSFERLPVHEDFYLYPHFYSVPENSTFAWLQMFGPTLKTSSVQPYLKIQANQMARDASYQFMLKAFTGNESTFALVSWNTASLPVCGELEVKVIENTVVLNTHCSVSDSSNLPLSFIYGVVEAFGKVPIKINHSPCGTLRLTQGTWTVFAEICDSLNSCTTQSVSLLIEKRLNFSLHQNEYYPDLLPEKLFSLSFLKTQSNIVDLEKKLAGSALNDLSNFLSSRMIDLVHLKMTIQLFEVFKTSFKSFKKSWFMEKVLKFFKDISPKVVKVDDESMNYITELFDNVEEKFLPDVLQVIRRFSYRWAEKMHPGESRRVFNGVSVIRSRFLENLEESDFEFNCAKIKSVQFEGKKDLIYDIFIIEFPTSDSCIIDLRFYQVGVFNDFTVRLHHPVLHQDELLRKSFETTFEISYPDFYTCQELKGESWTSEGCKVTNRSYSSVTVRSWHSSTYKVSIEERKSVSLGPIILETTLILSCVLTVLYVCIIDKAKSNYIKMAFDNPQQVNPKNDSPQKTKKPLEENKDSPEDSPFHSSPSENSPLDSPEKRIEESPPQPTSEKLGIVEILSPVESPRILFHPFFNLFYQQPAERRPASALHCFAVVFAGFAATGGIFYQGFFEVLADDGSFAGLEVVQIFFIFFALALVQILSALLMISNQVDDGMITKRYIGMAVSAGVIVLSAVAGFFLCLEYSEKYSYLWMTGFSVFLALEFAVFQNVWWLVNLKVFRKKGNALAVPSRGIRVLTQEE